MEEINKLAIFGGNKVIKKPFIRYNPIAKEEKTAALNVIESGVLSKFLGEWSPDFLAKLIKSCTNIGHVIPVNQCIFDMLRWFGDNEFSVISRNPTISRISVLVGCSSYPL